MFEILQAYIASHETMAPWAIFFSIALAGFNIPVSIDLLIILVAITAAHATHLKWQLFTGFFLGCILAAWISYGVGRYLGPKLTSKLLSTSKQEKIAAILKKYGATSFFIGRFIPFGFRNCLFMTAGLSKYRFIKFAFIDALACLIWSSLFFSLFFSLGTSFDEMKGVLKMINLSIIAALGVTVIGLFWYKYKKRLPADKTPHE
jgi:membrane-associated protein